MLFLGHPVSSCFSLTLHGWAFQISCWFGSGIWTWVKEKQHFWELELGFLGSALGFLGVGPSVDLASSSILVCDLSTPDLFLWSIILFCSVNRTETEKHYKQNHQDSDIENSPSTLMGFIAPLSPVATQIRESWLWPCFPKIHPRVVVISGAHFLQVLSLSSVSMVEFRAIEPIETIV